MSAKQVAGIVGMLRALPVSQLVEVLRAVDAEAVLKANPKKIQRARSVCGYCGKPYLICRDLYSADHEWEGPKRG